MNRKKIGFSVGWELEANRAAVITPPAIDRGRDSSVRDEGVEYRLKAPYFLDAWDSMNQLSLLTSLRRMAVDTSCGFHVHLGLQNYPKSYTGLPSLWASWCVVLAKEIEDYCFRAVPASRDDNATCKRWKGVSVASGIIKQRYNRSKYDNPHRYYWLNVTEMFREQGIRTVEIRLLGNTARFDYIVAWIGLCLHIGHAAYRLISDPSLLPIEVENIRVIAHDVERIRDLKKQHADEVWRILHQVLPKKYTQDEFIKWLKRGEVNKDAPAPNTLDRELDMRNKYHFGHSYDYEWRERQGQVKVSKNCYCDSCNYIHWVEGTYKPEEKTNVEVVQVKKVMKRKGTTMSFDPGMPQPSSSEWSYQFITSGNTNVNLGDLRVQRGEDAAPPVQEQPANPIDPIDLNDLDVQEGR